MDTAAHTLPATPRHDQRLRLRDGHWLGYGEYGDPAGQPVFLFHGIPGSRRLRHPDEALTASLGMRLIVPERPGFGLSDFQAGRRLLDWPADVAALAAALGVERFGVVGLSAGGPYAAACAWAMPERLSGVAIVSGVPPVGRLRFAQHTALGVQLARQAPRLAAAFVALACHRLQRATAWTEALLPSADRAMLRDPAIQAMRRELVAEAVRGGVRGLLWDAWLLGRPWGFRLAEIAVPVQLWHGGQDANVPWPVGRYLARTIPRSRVHYFPEEGHWLLFTHWQEILSGLCP